VGNKSHISAGGISIKPDSFLLKLSGYGIRKYVQIVCFGGNEERSTKMRAGVKRDKAALYSSVDFIFKTAASYFCEL